MFVRNNKIYFPKEAYKILNIMKYIPGYGINTNHKSYNKNDLILNDNTFLDYIKHAFIAGLNPEQFFLETFLHETLHLGGSSALRKGFTELKTRQLDNKYNFITSGCGYPKEVKIANILKEKFGEHIFNKILFAQHNYEIINILKNEINQEATDLYMDVNNKMDEEFYNKYYKYKFPGIMGP